MTATDLGLSGEALDVSVQPARNRRATIKAAVVHRVPVRGDDTDSTLSWRRALCGQTARYGWVLRPSWPERQCAKCLRLAGDG